MTVALTDDPVGYYVNLANASTPSAFDAPGTVEGVQQHYPFRVHDTGSSRDPSEQDTRSTEEIARLLAEAAGMFGDKPQSGNRTYRPTRTAAPGRPGSPRT